MTGFSPPFIKIKENPMSNKYPKLKPVKKDSQGLMDAMWDELNMLREGNSTVARANTVVKMASQICILARLHHEGITITPNKLPQKT